MIQLPIGEHFEALVRWLKASFKAFFDFFSDLLDFSITLLEDVLLLNAQVPAASVIFGLVLALLVGLLVRRKGGWKGFAAGAVVTLVVFGALESWRVGTLDSRVTPAVAEEMTADFAALRDSLEASAPDDFTEAEALLESVEAHLRNVAGGDDAVDDLAREARKTASAIGRTRPRDYENVHEELSEFAAAVDASGVDVPRPMLAEVEREAGFYGSLRLVEECDRLVGDCREAAAAEPRQRLNAVLNARTHLALGEAFGSAQSFYESEGDAETAGLVERSLVQLQRLNPDRLGWYGPLATIALLLLIAYLVAGRGIVLFSLVGFFLVVSMDLWVPTVESLALVISATLFALVLGIPIGIAAAGSQGVDKAVRPILDLMQTMPAFVYLIPAVIFFGLGKVPGAMATLIFAMPPAVRLTTLGIRQVPAEVVEAAESFGSTPAQLLFKAQLPIAMQTILAGINQTIMLALSMVVIGGMIGAGGLGEVVLSGITQLKLGLGFEGGIAVVILAIYLDRVTQALGVSTPKKT
jgi:glycine betaine/proline transport system permease protein